MKTNHFTLIYLACSCINYSHLCIGCWPGHTIVHNSCTSPCRQTRYRTLYIRHHRLKTDTIDHIRLYPVIAWRNVRRVLLLVSSPIGWLYISNASSSAQYDSTRGKTNQEEDHGYYMNTISRGILCFDLMISSVFSIEHLNIYQLRFVTSTSIENSRSIGV